MIGAVSSSSVLALSATRQSAVIAAVDRMALQVAPSSVAAAPALRGGQNPLSASAIIAAQSVADSACSDCCEDDSAMGKNPLKDAEEQSKPKKAGEELSDDEVAQVKQLKSRDQEVRAHEHAHAATGGDLAGSPSYEYQQGPDGQRYAIGGEVKIDAAPVDGDPQATIEKMQRVIAAALAPAKPSGQDRAVAAQARAAMAEAQAQATSKGGDEREAQLNGDAGQAADERQPVSLLV